MADQENQDHPALRLRLTHKVQAAMPNDAPASRWLKSTQWLADHLGDPNLVVVDGTYFLPTQKRDATAEYLAAHVPGAVFFDIEHVADLSTDLPHMLPDEATFATAAGALGISDKHTIVVYDGAGLSSAPRVWWTFRIFGAADVFILDGGMPKWKAEGRPLQSGAVSRTPQQFKVSFDRKAVANVGDVKAALADPSTQVVDARSAGRFAGRDPEPRPGLQSGHMPGALNVPWGDIVENGQLVSRDRIAAAFAKGGVDLSQPIITTCGSGVSAVVLALGLDAIGAPPVRIYDGSWSEWASRSDCPIEKS